MKKISKNKKLLVSKYEKTKHNASRSMYLNNIKFKNWTSPQRGINLIKKLYEKN